MILTSKWHAEHPLAGQNTQQWLFPVKWTDWLDSMLYYSNKLFMLGNTLIFHASNPFRILDFNYVIATCQYCNLQDIAKAVYKKSSKLGFDCLEQSTKQLLHLLIHPQTTFKTKLDRCALNLYFFKDVVVLCSHLSSF